MRNELQKHKKSDKIKWIATALAVVMLGVGVTAAITKGFKDWNPYGWFDKKTEQPLFLMTITSGSKTVNIGFGVQVPTAIFLPEQIIFS